MPRSVAPPPSKEGTNALPGAVAAPRDGPVEPEAPTTAPRTIRGASRTGGGIRYQCGRLQREGVCGVIMVSKTGNVCLRPKKGGVYGLCDSHRRQLDRGIEKRDNGGLPGKKCLASLWML